MWNILFPSIESGSESSSNLESKSQSSSTCFQEIRNFHSPDTTNSSSSGNSRHTNLCKDDKKERGEEINRESGMMNDVKSTEDVSIIVRNISSYLSLSDAESVGSFQSMMETTNNLQKNCFHHHHQSKTSSGDHPSYTSHAMTYSRPTTTTTINQQSVSSSQQQNLNSNSMNNKSTTFAIAKSNVVEDNDADAAAGFGSVIIANNNCVNNMSSDTGSFNMNRYDEEDDRPGLTLLLDDEEEQSVDANMYEPWKKPQYLATESNAAINHKHVSKNNIAPTIDKHINNNNAKFNNNDDASILCDERDDSEILARMRYERNKMLQKKLSEAVMSNQQSLRTYCSSTRKKAIQKIKENKKNQNQFRQKAKKCDSYYNLCSFCQELMPELIHGTTTTTTTTDQQQNISSCKTCDGCQSTLFKNTLHDKRMPVFSFRPILPNEEYHHKKHQFSQHVFRKVFQNIPLSVLLDFSEHVLNLTIQTTISSCEVSSFSIKHVLSTLSSIIHSLWVWIVTHINPWTLLETIQKLQKNAFDRTSEAIVTGLQSVATGVESAAAFYNFSTDANKYSSSTDCSVMGRNNSHVGSLSSIFEKVNNLLRRETSTQDHVISEKLYDKLSKIDTTSKVVSYLEREDEALTHHAKKRVQRMMHYHVSLRPFVATVILSPSPSGNEEEQLFENIDFPFEYELSPVHNDKMITSPSSSSTSSPRNSSDSPFMCSPKSFPQTPSSRAHVMARGTRFTEDVVFLARDHLRLEEGMSSCNEQTRVMANALREGSRLAVFNAADSENGIVLTCGQHCATKVGNDLYCTTRGMIPVLRNRYVYFEISVSSPPMRSDRSNIFHHTSLSIGLSTLEMPLNTLVGAWKGSIGLCTTGQILSSGQWFTPPDPRASSYGSNSTIGCLVYLDDGSAIETWDGYLVTATVVFNIDGNVVESPLTTVHPTVGNSSNNSHNLNTSSSTSQDEQQQSALQHNAYPLYLKKEDELFPTLTLHSTLTEAFCRFSAEDILAKSRDEIGVPCGSVIYAVDGSVLFDVKTNRRYYDSEEAFSIYSSDSMTGDEDSDNDS